MATDLERESTDDVLEIEGDLVTSSGAIEALNRSEIDIQIRTAKAYPRSIRSFKNSAMEMACLDEETAGSMFYVLNRGGKQIEGPSVRLAEVVGSAYSNLRYGARVVGIDDKFVVAQGACHDLEKNIAATIEVRRRITNKKGERFNDDMIQVTSNAACSIALRQAIFKVVPFAFVKGIYEQAKLTSVGENVPMNVRRHNLLTWYKKAGASEEQVLAFLERPGVDDITIDDVVMMRGLMNAIKDGETTIEEALQVEHQAGNKVRSSSLNKKINPAKQPEPEASDEAAQPAQDEPESDPAGEVLDGDQVLAAARQRLWEATDLITVNLIYDELCGPESPFLDDVTRQRAYELVELRRSEIKSGRGAGSNKKKDGLFEKSKSATEH